MRDLTSYTVDQLNTMLDNLHSAGYELTLESPCLTADEFEADMARLQSEISRIADELARRDHAAEEDGRHTLVPGAA